MKILIYSANYAPELTGIGKYSGEMGAWLSEHGHDVQVITSKPHYPDWKIHDGYRWPPYSVDKTHPRLTVHRAPIWVPGRLSGMRRLLHQATFVLSSFPLVCRAALWRPDVVFCVAPVLMLSPAALLLARVTGAKSWLHIQDFEVDVAFRMGVLRGGIAQRAVLSIERTLLGWFDRVSSISGKMTERALQKGVAPAAVRFFPNWVDTSAIHPLEHCSGYREELGIPSDATVCLFSGTWGSKQGLMVIPAAARALRDRADIHFVICGNGVMRPEIESACADLPNVHLLPLQPMARLNELLGMADIHLLPQSPEAEDLVLPSKLTGMLSSGRPVIATCRNDTEIGETVRRCGLLVPPEDGEALAGAILTLHSDPLQRKRLGLAARQYSDEYLAKEAILSKLQEDLQELAGAAERRPLPSGGA